MKQHITVEQLNELSKKSREKYRIYTWSKYEGKDIDSMQDYLNGRIYRKKDKDLPLEFYPLLSIGQMIEFLDEHRKRDWGIYFGKNLAFIESIDMKNLLGKTPKNPSGELCDGLWEGVKEILEQTEEE